MAAIKTYNAGQILMLFECHTKHVHKSKTKEHQKITLAQLEKLELIESRGGDGFWYPSDRGRCLINYILSLPVPVKAYKMEGCNGSD